MNTYPDSVRFLYSLGNEVRAVKFGLETIERVLAELGHPERACRIIHVAGTNGKGSTCAMLESALRAAGERSGLYTSPHLVQPTERIRIGGAAVSESEFSTAFDEVHAASEKLLARGAIENHPTYFETVTAMAFLLFRQHECTRAVLEVGLGGRLDATNVVVPELCVITPVDYDHESFLGSAIEQIAAEKAGILKPGIPLVLAKQRSEAEAVIQHRAAELSCPVFRVADEPPIDVDTSESGSEIHWRDMSLRCPLAGAHQVDNTLTAALALTKLGVPREAIENGIAEARWPGRLQRVATSPDIILDGAHNPAGMRALAEHIRHFYPHRKVWLIYGTMRDKSIGEIADTLFPLAHELILTAPDSPRALDPRALLTISGHAKARVASNLTSALEITRREAAAQDVIFISGSLYLVGEALTLFVQ
ncbi:MAG: bifunctional folylpolyglutamate synthase/dihydrofolate synthase [Candidatus Solibacter usitatus]|nr:bifunctional folylpolyglutamate synthase/dihydrofolate synthase [Candidatus Solibacter usitatus]